MRTLSPAGTFLLYAAICFVGWIGAIRWYPECAGLTLEEIGDVFKGNGSAVQTANQILQSKRKVDTLES
jgi:MFS transporter, SP family, solute carrier family 2 (myo-inositol transporter), member 13